MSSFRCRKLPLVVFCRLIMVVGFSALSVSVFAQDEEKTLPVFEDGQAQVVEGFNDPSQWIRHELWVETEFDSDGNGRPDRMHVSVTRQAQTDSEGLKVPVVYVTSPYFSGTGSTNKEHFWDPEQEVGAEPPEKEDPPHFDARIRRPNMSQSHIRTWLPCGFAVVHSASPGTGLSQGCPTVGGDNESLAPKAVIDWLCGRATGFTSPDGDETVEAYWSTGRVGMTGTSYNGTLPLAAATTGVDGLEAIIPIAPNTSYYHYYRSYGLVRHPGGWMGEDIDILYNFINSGDRGMRQYCDSNVRDKILREGFDRVSGDYNDFWAGRDYLNDLGPLKAPVLMAHAFNDWNVMPEHSVRIVEALKEKGVPVQVYFHQGGHGGEPPHSQMNRWFTRYLYEIENGVEEDPKSWIVREGDDRQAPTAYEDYPHPSAEDVTFYLEGKTEGPSVLTLDENRSMGLESFTDNVNFRGAELAQQSESTHRLLFATPELNSPLHLSGTAEIKIRLSSSKPAANLSIWLVSLPWTGSRQLTDDIITRGWADPQNHESLRESEPLVPGEFYELSFKLQPDDQVIAAGEQIGLMIFSSDRDFTLWPEPGTELTIDLEATSLSLPIVGGEAAYREATDQ